jgi:hypothetical protein
MGRPRTEGLGAIIASHFGVDEIPGSAASIAGSFWLNKVLDPCHPSTGVLGVPDADVSNVVTPQYMATEVLDNSTGGLTNVAGTQPWDPTATWNFCHIVDFSVMQHCILKWQGDITGSPSTMSLYVTDAKVGTLLPQVGTLYPLSTGADFMRLTYAGLTYEPSMPTLADQGRMVACQIKSRYEDIHQVSTGAAPGPTSISDVLHWSTNSTANGTSAPINIAPFLASLTVLDDSALVGPAKQGAYFPVRWSEPTHAYSMMDRDYGFSVDLNTTGSARRSYIMPFTSSNTSATPTGYADNYTGYLTSPLKNQMPWNACVMYCTGLHSDSNFQVVYRYGVELQITPVGTSTLMPFHHPSPTSDELALVAADRIRNSMASAYPADYNFLDKLWGVIKNTASKVLPGLVGGAASMIPGIGPIAGPALSGLLGSMFPKPRPTAAPLSGGDGGGVKDILLQLLSGLQV